jgi:hypothetical protein
VSPVLVLGIVRNKAKKKNLAGEKRGTDGNSIRIITEFF